MRAVQIRGTAKKIQQLVQLGKQALRDGAYRVANRLHAVALNMEGRTAPEIADVLKVHRSNVCLWLERWQVDGMEGILEGHRAGRPPAISGCVFRSNRPPNPEQTGRVIWDKAAGGRSEATLEFVS